MTIDDLITNNEIKSKAITDLINKTDNEAELDKLHACRRFIRGFIDELKQLKNKRNDKTRKAKSI